MKQEKENSIYNLDKFDYQFTLRRLQAGLTNRLVQADFTPMSSKSGNNLLKVFPIFNGDKKAYMPSFIQPSQIENYQEHQNIYKALHQKKLIEANQEKDDLFLPKPSKKNSCCCICKTLYQDYLTHITNPQHELLLQKSPFNNDIYEMCLSFSLIKKNVSQQTTYEEDFCNKPKKKRKIESKRKSSKRNQQSGISTMIDSLGFLTHRIVAEAII